jgi:hypothetical protein
MEDREMERRRDAQGMDTQDSYVCEVYTYASAHINNKIAMILDIHMDSAKQKRDWAKGRQSA